MYLAKFLTWLVALINSLAEDDLPTLQPTDLEPRIVGGTAIEVTEAPFQVHVLRDGNFSCGGVILDKKTILTAAHCVAHGVNDPKVFSVRAGSSVWTTGGSLHSVKKAVKHFLYSSVNHNDDVGMLYIDPPIKFDGYRQPIRIASREPSGGDIVTISGWGLLDLKKRDKPPLQLHLVEVPIVALDECAKFYNELDSFSPAFVCYGKAGKNSCIGDSGGPVVRNGELVGIVSFNKGCGGGGSAPGIGTNVVSPLINNWIVQNQNENI